MIHLEIHLLPSGVEGGGNMSLGEMMSADVAAVIFFTVGYPDLYAYERGEVRC